MLILQTIKKSMYINNTQSNASNTTIVIEWYL